MTETIVTAKWVVRGVVDRDRVDLIEDRAILHRDGIIVAIGTLAEMQALAPQANVIRHDRHMLLPGFINSHHHVGLTPLQLGSPDLPLELWFAGRLPARDVDLYLDTLYSAFEMIASGVTTVQHIQGWHRGGLEGVHAGATRVLDAYRAIGMRASYCFAFREQNRLVYGADEEFAAGLPGDLGPRMLAHYGQLALSRADYLALYDRLAADCAADSRLRIQLSPANLHWCTDEGLQALEEKSAATGAPMHVHLLETPFQKEYARRRTATSAVRHLEKLGILGARLTLGHGVWLTEEDIEIVASTGTCLCHNCSSNFRLRSGLAPLNRFAAHEVTIAIGIDEAGINDDRDMLQEMRMVLRAHRVPGMSKEVPTCPQVLRMATEHGAKTTPFGDTIGRLEPGRFFDAVAIDWEVATFPHQDEAIPPLDAIVMRAKPTAVSAVYCEGEALYVDGRFMKVDRDAVLEAIAEALARPRTQEEEARLRLGRELLPHVRRFYEGYLDREERVPFYLTSSKS